MREEGKSHSAISNYLHSIKAFYRINDIVLNVYEISKFMPEHIKVDRDRAHTHQEIGKMLEVANQRMRVVVLLVSVLGYTDRSYSFYQDAQLLE